MKAGKTLGEVMIDFTPVIGDIKSFAEAQDALDYGLAIVGMIPGADVAKKTLKEAKNALAAAEKSVKAGNRVEAEKLLAKANTEIAKVKALDVDTYGNLKARSVVGDNLEHDHIPSFAAI